MKVLVVGGAGYIGSHMVKKLLSAGLDVVVLDNLSTGHRDAVLGGQFVLGDIEDTTILEKLFRSMKIDAVMHFASFIQVGESVQDPSKYYRNNFNNTLNLLDTMVAHGVKHFIFSSTAAIYGEPKYIPINELHILQPTNPYGRTKLMVEQLLHDYDRAYHLKSICLRYFNAAGADPEGDLGERHEPETHLIPILLQVASGRRQNAQVFGRDYDTQDGTCVRDYIHVNDLCDAHLLALNNLRQTNESKTFNLGNGSGFSVQQIIDTVEKVTNTKLNIKNAERRPGDPSVLVADSTRAKSVLKWEPRYSDIKEIILHAWQWEKRMKN